VVFSERRIQAAFAETIAFFHSSRIPYMVVGALAADRIRAEGVHF
jgi:hypothetical protein